MQMPLHRSSCHAKRTECIFEGFDKSWVTKGSILNERMTVQGGNGRVGNSAVLTVTVRLCLPRNFSSDTELGIRTSSPVRRGPNKERPYELLIVRPPLPQHSPPLRYRFPLNPVGFAGLSIVALWAQQLSKREGAMDIPERETN